MKPTFNKLPAEKKQRIMNACIEEFGEHSYEGSSIDRIIKKAGISKGGLYEYVSAKEELFLYTVEYTYTHLYDYLKEKVNNEKTGLPEDLLQRLKHLADFAIDFYMAHPHFISLIVKTSNLSNEKIDRQIKQTFNRHFLDLFYDIDSSSLAFPKEQVLELAMWMLLKTRMDFLLEIKTEKDPEKVKTDYRSNWDFYLAVLTNGIYR